MIGIVGACLDRYEQATSSMLLSRSNGDQEGVEQSSHRHVADFKLVSAAVLAAACFCIATGPWVISTFLPGDIVLIYSFQKARNG